MHNVKTFTDLSGNACHHTLGDSHTHNRPTSVCMFHHWHMDFGHMGGQSLLHLHHQQRRWLLGGCDHLVTTGNMSKIKRMKGRTTVVLRNATACPSFLLYLLNYSSEGFCYACPLLCFFIFRHTSDIKRRTAADLSECSLERKKTRCDSLLAFM